MSGSLYMDAVITPHRSLSDRGFMVLISIITVANCASAAVFLKMGATLVPVFLGIDVLAVLVALLVSIRRARNRERVQVSASEVRVVHETPAASTLVWESPTAFTRLFVERDEDQVTALRLALSGREIPVAAALSPRERTEFAKALDRAIWKAKRGAPRD
jgi:uncharacterized membrane protein